MRGPFKYEQLSKYPHLSKMESDIWDRFVRKYPDAYYEAYYDVELGDIRGDVSELQPEWQKDAQYLGKYKIDVLCKNSLGWTIIEVKKSATTKALGEIWLYDFLFKQEWPDRRPIFNAIVTDEEMPNIRTVAEAENVQLYVV